MAQKHVVVIGAGPAGINLVLQLAELPSVKVTLLERKDHFDIVVGNPRAAVNGAYADEAVKMYKDVLPANVEFIQIREVSTLGKGGPVTYVTRAGETCTLQPEVLVIATGSSYKGGLMKNNDCLDKAEWLAKLQKFRASCARSQHIMVVGGGVTGLELAGEIAHDFGIKVTLVHSTQHLFDMGPKVHNACMKAARSVPSLEIVLGERARQAEVLEAQTPFDVTAESGRVFHCVDMVVHAFGVIPNTGFVDAKLLGPNGFLKADNRLVCEALSSEDCTVFAIGDCCDRGRGRAMYAMDHADAVVKQIRKLASGTAAAVLPQLWPASKDTATLPVMASVSRANGVMTLPFANNLGGRWLKAPSLLVGMLYQYSPLKKMGKGPGAPSMKFSKAALEVDPSCSKAAAATMTEKEASRVASG